MVSKATLRRYYHLTKPGIIYGNDLAVIAGFFIATQHHILYRHFFAVLIGTSLVIASACVCNNYIDRNIDQKMQRTKRRALVQGTITARSALTYAAVLGIFGVALLASFVNLLTAAVGAFGFFAYVVLYGIAKRRTVNGTLVGSISGALPPVAGYTAVTGRVDGGAVLLFIILTAWQMPHFYAIAIYRSEDYKAAHIPVLPLVKGAAHTKLQIMSYIVLFIVAAALLTGFGYTGYLYLIVMTCFGFAWLFKGWRTWHLGSDAQWARQMFFFSLIILLAFSVLAPLGAHLP